MKHFLNILWLMTAVGVTGARATESPAVSDRSWTEYGYIGIGAVLLIIIVVVLTKKPARRPNE